LIIKEKTFEFLIFINKYSAYISVTTFNSNNLKTHEELCIELSNDFIQQNILFYDYKMLISIWEKFQVPINDYINKKIFYFEKY